MYHKLPIGRQLIALVALINLIVLAGIIIAAAASASNALQEQAKKRFIDADFRAVDALEHGLETLVESAEALAEVVSTAGDVAAPTLLRADIQQVLRNDADTLIQRVNVYRPGGEVFIYDIPNPTSVNSVIAGRRTLNLPDAGNVEAPWIFAARETASAVWSLQTAPYFYSDPEPMLSLALRYDAGRGVGVLWVDVSLEAFDAYVVSILNQEGAAPGLAGGYILLFDEYGELLAGSEQLDLASDQPLEPAFDELLLMSPGVTVDFVNPINETASFAFVTPFEDLTWRAVSVIPLSELPVVDIRLVMLLLFIGFFGMILLLLVVNRFINKVVANALINLSWAAQEIGSGDMRYRIGFQERQDEIGRLARALEEMKSNLAHSQAQLAASSRTLEARVENRTKEFEQARQEAHRHAAELSAIYAESLLVVNEPQLKPILQALTQRLLSLLKSSYCGVWLLNSDKTHLQLVETTAGQPHMDAVIETGQGLVGEVMDDLKPVVVSDYHLYKRRILLKGEAEPMIYRAIGVPLVFGGRPIGALVLGRGEDGLPYNDDEERMLALFANLVSPAVRNAQLLIQRDDAVREAEKANQVKTRFLASVTHELRTPLNLIINNMDFMRIGVFGEINDEQLLRLNQTIRSAEHLLYLINDLLDVSKIEAGEMQLFRQPSELYPLLEDAVDAARVYIEKMGKKDNVRLVTDIAENLPKIPIDSRRIRQVLVNLLSNAVKFTPEGEVKLTVLQQGHHVRFVVSDEGIGIPPDEVPRLFAAFERTTQAKLHNIEGTGLGLPISRFLVQQHGGDIVVTSAEGVGSTFSFTLPVDETAMIRKTDTQLMAVLAVDQD